MKESAFSETFGWVLPDKEHPYEYKDPRFFKRTCVLELSVCVFNLVADLCILQIFRPNFLHDKHSTTNYFFQHKQRLPCQLLHLYLV